MRRDVRELRRMISERQTEAKRKKREDGVQKEVRVKKKEQRRTLGLTPKAVEKILKSRRYRYGGWGVSKMSFEEYASVLRYQGGSRLNVTRDMARYMWEAGNGCSW